jgi:hypothetical protein
MVVKQTVLGVLSIWSTHSLGFLITMIDANTLTFSFDQANFTASFNPTGVIASDTWCVIDVVFDGTQSGDANRFKVYVDGAQQALSFTGSVPAAYPNISGVAFEFGHNGFSFAGALDEIRMKLGTFETDDEIELHYNQWFDKATYWTVTVQPVITSVTSLGKGRYRINGSGFKPENTDPTGNVDGIVFTVISADDSEVIVSDNSGGSLNSKTFALTNSDSESDTYNNIKQFKMFQIREVIMVTKCYPISDVWLNTQSEDAPEYCDILEIRNDPSMNVQQPDDALELPTNYPQSSYLTWVLANDPNVLVRTDGTPASRQEHIIAARFNVDSGIRVGDTDPGNNIRGILRENNHITIGEYYGGIDHGEIYTRIYRDGTSVEKLWFLGC